MRPPKETLSINGRLDKGLGSQHGIGVLVSLSTNKLCWTPGDIEKDIGLCIFSLPFYASILKGIVHNFFIFGQISYFE